MSLVLWTSEDDGVSLGDPFALMREWSGLAKIIGPREAAFSQLLAVPYTNEEQQPPEWIASAQSQAANALKLPGLSEHVRWALDRIARLDTSAADEPMAEQFKRAFADKMRANAR